MGLVVRPGKALLMNKKDMNFYLIEMCIHFLSCIFSALKHSPSKRGKRESVKNSTSSKLENSNSPEAPATVVGASNATSTTGPTPAPNGGATTTQGTGK